MKSKKPPKVSKRIINPKKIVIYSLAITMLFSFAQSYVKAETSELEAKLDRERTEQVKADIINVSATPPTTDASLIKGNEPETQLEPQGEEISSKPPTTPKAVKASSHQDKEQLAHAIHGLESSYGKNDGCKRDGQGFNGYGYGQNKAKGKWTCFSSPEEAKAAVINWINKHQDMEFSTPTLLCYYNTGHKVNDCPYYQDYKQLIEI